MIGTIKAFGPVAAIVVLGIVVTVVVKWVNRRRWRQRFVEAFHFEPEKDWPGRTIQKQDVDRKLGQFAYEFNQACKTESAIFDRHLRPDPGYFSQKEELKKLRGARERVRRTKSEFWTAHKAAQVSGFSVEEKYGDYLK